MSMFNRNEKDPNTGAAVGEKPAEFTPAPA